MSKLTRLAGKVFAFSLPEKEDNKNYCKLLKDHDQFVNRVLEIKGCKEVEGINVCGICAITFDLDDCPYTDDEIIKMIDDIANDIGLED